MPSEVLKLYLLKSLSRSSLLAFCIITTPALASSVVEFYNTNLDNYFITADTSEAAQIDGGSAGPGWIRTGNTFESGGSTPVCRFYGSQSPGPNSHFYTADSAECQGLKDQQIPAGDPRKLTIKSWNFESLDFVSTPPTNGSCPGGTVPVYRAYNNGFSRGVDSNHRITSSLAAIQQVVARGWNNEGVVMCAPGSGTDDGGGNNADDGGGNNAVDLSSLQGSYSITADKFVTGDSCPSLGELSGAETFPATVTTSGNTVTIIIDAGGDSCTANLTYVSGNSTSGFNLNGSMLCSSSGSANMTATNLRKINNQPHGSLTVSVPGCAWTDTF